MQLTDRQIKSAKTDDRDLFLGDGRGLYLRVRSSGSKVWIYRYRAENITHRLQLGTYPSMTLAAARLETQKAKSLRDSGVDPLEVKQQQKANAATEKARISARNSVTDLLERWVHLDLSNHKDGGKEIRRLFEKDVLPSIGEMAVEDVKKGHVIAIVDTLLSRGVDRLVKNDPLAHAPDVQVRSGSRYYRD